MWGVSYFLLLKHDIKDEGESIMKKTKALLLLGSLLFAMCVSGCSSADTTSSDKESSVVSEQSKESSEASKEVSDEKQDTIGQTKEKADIEALASDSVFNVNWYTQEGEYAAGTSFLLDSNVHGEKLLVTAFHFLWPDEADTFTGKQLPEFILGGEIYRITDYEATSASLKSCLIIEDADVAPAVNKDVAAFTIQNGEDLKTLTWTDTVKTGEKVFLLANLWDTEDIHENCVYEGEVIGVEDGVLYYNLDGTPGTAGASGGPIVNEYGEVVAIHIGSGGGIYMAHTAESFMKQIEKSAVSDIVYSEPIAGEAEDISAETYLEYIDFALDEKVMGSYFDVQIDAVEVCDTLMGEACLEGYQYVLLDISVWAPQGVTEAVTMNDYDFCLEWEEEYCYPLEYGWTSEQLKEEYSITQEGTSGQLVFLAPLEKETVKLTFANYYYEDEASAAIYGVYSAVEIPLENWTR